jgi:hypothetical protein
MENILPMDKNSLTHDSSYSDEDGVEINEWSKKKKKFCKELANKRGAYVWLYNSTSKQYSLISTVFGICAATFVGILGILGIINDTVIQPNHPNGNINTFGLVVSILVAATAIVSGIKQYTSLDDRAKKHKHLAGKSSGLFLDIRKELAKNPERRMPANKFIHKKLEDDIDLINELLHVPRRIVRKYYQRFGKRAIKYEILFGERDLLMIEEDEKSKENSDDPEKEIVARAMINMSKYQSIHTKISMPRVRPIRLARPVNNNNNAPDVLESCIQEHEKKRRRPIPEMSAKQMFDLEKYLADDNIE